MSDKKTVLLVSLFHPELVRGGAQQVSYELFEGLREDPEYHPVLLASIDANYPALYKSGARITGFDQRPDEFLFLSRDYDHTGPRTRCSSRPTPIFSGRCGPTLSTSITS